MPAFDIDKDSLLPAQRTSLELALESLSHERMFETLDPAVVGNVYDVDNAPAEILPWLAWQWGLDVWDPNWTEDQQREALRNVASVMGTRGTVKSVKDAIAPWGASLSIGEWFELVPVGAPHTFNVYLSVGAADLPTIKDAIDRTKPLRSHYTLIPGAGARQGVGVGPIARSAKITTISATL